MTQSQCGDSGARLPVTGKGHRRIAESAHSERRDEGLGAGERRTTRSMPLGAP
jgi:hypothetical protein